MHTLCISAFCFFDLNYQNLGRSLFERYGEHLAQISTKLVADKLSDNLNHNVSKGALIDRRKQNMWEETFSNRIVQEIAARFGSVDAKTFEINWKSPANMLGSLGHKHKVGAV